MLYAMKGSTSGPSGQCRNIRSLGRFDHDSPLVAKIPVVMKPSANEVYRFRIEGKTLTLRHVQNARGVAVDSAPTFKFVRAE
jgi:hypothetical protein